MENKVVKYECRNCNQKLERKEFHYQNFETLSIKKVCWDCEIENKRLYHIQEYIDICKNKNEEIDSLKNRIKYLEKITSISTPIKTIRVPKYKHRSMNIYMEEGNVNEAWKLHKGQYRLYRTYPNKFIENDSCIIYKRPDGTNKYYGLMKMHEWIMETVDFAILS